VILAVATLAALSALVPPSGAEAGGRPAVGLAAAPARVLLPAGGTRTVRVLNPGRANIVVEARPAGYALDVRGRPRIVADRAGAWRVAEPLQVAVPPRGSAELRIAARVPRGVRPGDHAALLLLTTRPVAGGGVPARIRIGVVVVVRVPGRIVHRVAIVGVALRRSGGARVLEIRAANRGNVDEWVGARRVVVVLQAAGRRGVRARLHPGARRFLARSSGLLLVRVPATVRGRVRVVVALARPRAGVAVSRRAFWLRL
jgi:hypothetical protein